MKNGFEYSVVKYKIKEKIKQGKTNYIIYPNGNFSVTVRNILKEFNINAEFYIDNKNYDGVNVLNIQQAMDRGIGDCIILIASNNENYYDEIRENIYKAFSKDSILDLYPRYEIMEEEVDSCILELEEYINEVQKNVSYKYSAIFPR